MHKAISLILLACICAPLARAQRASRDETPGVEVFAGYSASGYFDIRESLNLVNQRFSPFFNDSAGGDRGFETSITGNLNRWIGIKADLSTYFNNEEGRGTFIVCLPAQPCFTSEQPFDVKTRALYFMGGPEVKARNSTRLTPFGHALFGVVRSHAEFSTISPVFTLTDKGSQTGFTMAFGGGVDVRLSTRIGVRTMMDYNPTFLHGSDLDPRSRQDHVRLSAGIIFH